MQPAHERYHTLVIALHWIMAIAFLLMLASGLLMEDIDDKATQFQVFQWHKSLGVLLLISFFLRLAVRLLTTHPAIPAAFKPLEKKATTIGHGLLYLCMLLVPFTGWATVSGSKTGLPTIVFGWFEWPHISFLIGNHDLHEFFEESHGFFAYAFMVLIAVHIAAVIKHAVVDRINLLPRMGITHSKKG